MSSQTFNVIVINKAGKVGKSTISKHLIAPMLDADWIQVETFNDSGVGAVAKLAGRRFEHVAQAIVGGKRSLCIDVGNSNYQAVMKDIQQIDGLAGRIDCWIIPCRESAGVMNDSLSTVKELMDTLDVDPSRIVVLPNDIEAPEDWLDNFKKVSMAAKEFGFHLCETAVPQNPKFDVFNADTRSVLEIADDATDYDAAIAIETDHDKRLQLTQSLILRSRARALAGKLKQVWAALPIAKLEMPVAALGEAA